MAFTKIQNAIISALESRNGIRWAELKRDVVDSQKVCSERIFREHLNELVKSEVIFKYEITPQHIEYYLQKKLENVENSLDEAFQRHYSQFEFVIKSIEKNIEKIPLQDRAGLIFSIWRMINNLEFMYVLVSLAHNKPKLLKEKDFKSHKIQLLNLVTKSKKEEDTIMLIDHLERIGRWETYQFADVIKKELGDMQIPWSASKNPS